MVQLPYIQKTIMKKILSVVAVVLIVVTAYFISTRKTEPKPTTNTLRIGLNSWIGNGLYFVAQEKGFFTKEGLTVTITNFTDGAIGKQLIASGQIDGISMSPETLVVFKDAGIDVKAVAMTDTSIGADGIVATKDIKTISDLKGKKVAYEEGSPSHFFLSYLLDQQGLSTKDIISVNVIAPDAGASFVAGKVDAAVTWEPWLSKVSEVPGGHQLANSKSQPILPALTIFRTQTITQQPQNIKKMLRALFAARDYIAQYPDESYGIIAKNFNISKQDVVDQIPTFKWFGYQENTKQFTSGDYSAPALTQKAADLWLKLGLIKIKINSTDLIDTSILTNLYQ